MILELGGCCSHWTVLYDVKPRTMLLLNSGYLRTLTRSHCTLGPSKTHYRLKLPAAIAISRVRPSLMLIEIDRSMSEFDRALIGSAIDFRGSFRSRAGGFAPPPPSLFATAIASMIGTTATARAAQLRATPAIYGRKDRILTPPCGGSNPPAPATQSGLWADFSRLARTADISAG